MAIVRRPSDTPTTTRDGAYLVSCTLTVKNEIREKPLYPGQMWKEYEHTGQRSGTFEAEIANCDLDVHALLERPSVFEWPEQRVFIAMQVMHVEQLVALGDIRRTLGDIRRTRVHGKVLGIAAYGATRIAEPEARRRLGMPPKQLTE